MEGLKYRYQNMSLRQSFIVTVFVTFGVVVLLSILVIWGCSSCREWLLPNSNTVILSVQATTADGNIKTYSATMQLGENKETDLNSLTARDSEGNLLPDILDPTSVVATVTKVENNYTMLTPKRKLAYQICGAAIIAFPVFISIAGVLLCGFTFYRRKLYCPLKILSDATSQIADQNLDFRLSYESEDELGKLCKSFEKMRQALNENSREMWKMIEERKLIQASIAHDLRNPIAIIEGYTEYLQLHLQAGNMSLEKARETVANIAKAANRLEQYTESVREINQLDEIELHRTRISTDELVSDITADLTLMASEAGKTLHTTGTIPSDIILIDTSILYRVLENILNNTLRFAKEKIELSFALQNRKLIISVADDGEGFSEEIRMSKNRLLLPVADGNGHCGMGLTISRLLCQKHGGRLELANRLPHGAIIKIILEV